MNDMNPDASALAAPTNPQTHQPISKRPKRPNWFLGLPHP